MSPLTRIFTALALSLFSAATTLAQKGTYAPTPPPILTAKQKPVEVAPPEVAQDATQFSIGDPTDEEQLHLELINRARADANAEAQRLIALSQSNPDVGSQFSVWQVDTNLMLAQFATNPPAAPLSFNARLIESARGHSQFQFDNAVQTHTGTNGSNVGNRANAAGYAWANLGENVFAYAMSVEQGHAGFEVDWGPGSGGMQSPPGHRNSIHNGVFVEIGVGIVLGENTVNGSAVGPQVVTEDFGRPQTATTYITGVAYYDLNGNNFYDLGEGLPDVTVTVDGVSTFAVTTKSGAYSIPVLPNHTYTVRFNATGLAETTQSITVTANNSKADFKPTYVAPTVSSGPTTAYVGVDNIYNLAAQPTASGYRARVSQVANIPTEGAEGNLDHLTITAFGGYPVVSTAFKASGAKSFHLGQMLDGNTVDTQIIEFNEHIHVFSGARIDFKSMMAAAGDGQFASFDVSEDDGANWTTLWSQFGAGQAGAETQFSARTASLVAYEGKTIRVRFVFDVNGSAILLPKPEDPSFNSIGWYLDDIAFTNVEALLGTTESPVFTQPKFTFNPAATGNYLLEFQAINGARTYPYGPAQSVTVQANAPTVLISKSITATPDTVTMQFTANATAFFSVETATSVSGPWTGDTTAVVTGPVQGVFTVTTPRNGEIRFYRVLAN